MTPEQFVYWLQGYAEVTDEIGVTAEQWQVIKDHLKEVFHKVTPDRSIGDLGGTPTIPYFPPYLQQQTIPMPPLQGPGTIIC